MTLLLKSTAKKYYFTQAINEAKKSKMQCQHGAILVENGNIIATAFNDNEKHAERAVIAKAARSCSLWTKEKGKEYSQETRSLCG